MMSLKFLRIFITAAVGGFLSAPIYAQTAAQVDPKIHKLCVEAKDYAGCVRAMQGDTTPTTRQINSQGADIAEGNECSSGWAYVGGGNCMEVKCYYGHWSYRTLGHDSRIAGKPGWGCAHDFWRGAGVMRLEGNSKASINSNCPKGEPPVGYNSTCQASLSRELESVK